MMHGNHALTENVDFVKFKYVVLDKY
jgi:hypothetical protein